MRASAILASGLAAVASATTTSTWSDDPTTTSSSTSTAWDYTTTSSSTKSAVTTSSTSYDPNWSVWSSSSSSSSKKTTSTSYDPSWSVWSSTTTSSSKKATSTSYDPSWSVWSSTTSSSSKKATSTSYDPSWSEWASTTISTAKKPASTVCPTWTGGAAPPAFYTNLPDSIKSALPAWTGAPPSDYCLYTSWMQSFSSCTAPAVKPTTLATTSSPGTTWGSTAKATGTSAVFATWTGTGVAPIATFKGVANVNAASYAVAGLAAAAALVMV